MSHLHTDILVKIQTLVLPAQRGQIIIIFNKHIHTLTYLTIEKGLDIGRVYKHIQKEPHLWLVNLQNLVGIIFVSCINYNLVNAKIETCTSSECLFDKAFPLINVIQAKFSMV